MKRIGHPGRIDPRRTPRLVAAIVIVGLLASACTAGTTGRVGGSGQGAGGSGPGTAGSGQGAAGSGQGAAGSGQGANGSGPGTAGSGQGAGGSGEGTGSPRPTLAVPAATSSIAPSPPGVTLRLDRVAGGLASPLFVTGAGTGDGRLYVVEQEGRVGIVEPDGSVDGTPLLDIVDRVDAGGERGLLGLAFHPAYAKNGLFYVDYTDADGNTVVSEFRHPPGSPQPADPASERILLRVEQPYPNHNGGMVAFGPDGYLYVGMGDGGSAGDPGNRAQDLGTLLGKILRIDVDHPADGRAYGVPATNPFAATAGARPEVWLLGVRNPWRFSFDRETGDLWIGDVGQDTWEEIDRLTAPSGGGRGADLGWRLVEGRACFDPPAGCSTGGLAMPLAVYGHDAGCAVTGGYVYRGTASPVLVGRYVFGDYCSGRIWGLDAAGPDEQEPALLLESGRTLSSFGQGDDGEIYLTDLTSGELFRVVAEAG